MSGQSIFQLLTPVIFLLFAVGFFVIYFNHKRLKAAAYFGASYLCGATAFVIDFNRLTFDPVVVSYSSNSLFLMVALLFTAGLDTRYDKPKRLLPRALIAAATMAGLTYFWFVDNDIIIRTLTMNTGVALIFATAIPVIIGAPKKRH